MNKQLILSIDAFDINYTSINYALGIAEQFDLSILLYSVQYTPSPLHMANVDGYMHPYYGVANLPEEIGEQAEKNMQTLCRRVQRYWPDTDYECDRGFMASTIVEKARWLLQKADERNPFLLIVNNENEYNWWNEVLGTAETSIAKQSPCPTLILPKDTDYRGFRQIMYLLDEQSLEAEKVPNIKWLSRFGKPFDASLAVAYLPETGEELSEKELDLKMAGIREQAGLQKFFYYQFPSENTAEDITKIAEISHTDILALPYRSTPLFERIFDNDNTRTLILKASTPVLVF